MSKIDPNKLAMWRTMRKFYVSVETAFGNRCFAILADSPCHAVANYFIHSLNRLEFSTSQEREAGLAIAFCTHYVVHEGCHDEGYVIDTAPIIWCSVFSNEERKLMARQIKSFASAAVYQAWQLRSQKFAPAGSTVFSDII
jgi:hypothetical protein